MGKTEIIYHVRLSGQLPVKLVNNRVKETEFEDIIEQLTDKECRELLLSGYSGYSIADTKTNAIVKEVVDAFDLYVIMPGDEGPEDEYDGESRRIAEKIEVGMSVKQITDIIEREFIRSFHASFPRELYHEMAEEMEQSLKRL